MVGSHSYYQWENHRGGRAEQMGTCWADTSARGYETSSSWLQSVMGRLAIPSLAKHATNASRSEPHHGNCALLIFIDDGWTEYPIFIFLYLVFLFPVCCRNFPISTCSHGSCVHPLMGTRQGEGLWLWPVAGVAGAQLVRHHRWGQRGRSSMRMIRFRLLFDSFFSPGQQRCHTVEHWTVVNVADHFS